MSAEQESPGFSRGEDVNYYDVREGLARRIIAADLAVVPRPVNVGGTDHDG